MPVPSDLDLKSVYRELNKLIDDVKKVSGSTPDVKMDKIFEISETSATYPYVYFYVKQIKYLPIIPS